MDGSERIARAWRRERAGARAPPTRAWLARAAALLAGAAGVHAARTERSAVARDARPITVWAADRGADRLLGLDRDLCVQRIVTIGAPGEIEVASDGTLWVLRSTARHALAPMELARLDADGRVLARRGFARAHHLVALAGGRAALIAQDEAEDGARIVIVEPDGAARALALASFAPVALAARGDLLCGAGARGELVLHRVGERVRVVASARPRGAILDVAPGPRGGSWWILVRTERGVRAELAGAGLRPAWSRELGVRATRWIASPTSPRTWLALEGGSACLALNARGSIVCFREETPLAPSGSGLSRDDGSVLLVHPGAILALDARGRSTPGQGGFHDLSDLALAGEERR